MTKPNGLPAIANPDFAAVRSGSYTIDPAHTRVLFSVSHFGFSSFYGEFASPAGSLRIDPANLAASALSIQVPVANVVTGNGVLDDELRSPEWLDSDRFPMITLQGRRYSARADGAIAVDAELSFHGVTQPVLLEVRFVGAGMNPKNGAYTVGFDVRGAIKRSEFGVNTLPLIGNELQLIISVALELSTEESA